MCTILTDPKTLDLLLLAEIIKQYDIISLIENLSMIRSFSRFSSRLNENDGDKAREEERDEDIDATEDADSSSKNKSPSRKAHL